jgi:hypothetical protein
MSDTTAPPPAQRAAFAWPADPEAYRVQRLRTGGRLTALRVIETQGARVLGAYADDREGRLDDFIRAAHAEERHDPHCEKLPTDRAMIIAALRQAGIEPAEGAPSERPARDFAELIVELVRSGERMLVALNTAQDILRPDEGESAADPNAAWDREATLARAAWADAVRADESAAAATREFHAARHAGREPPASLHVEMLAMLAASAGQFRSYERQHRAKGTAEAAAKADTNARMAADIEALLARTWG